MGKFVDKLSSYNILNNMLPGAVFCNLLNTLMNISILKDGIVEELFICYFAGMVIGRIGSVIVEPICKGFKLVTFAPHKEFVKASLKDEMINILSETNNTYRTMLSMCLLIFIIKMYLLIIAKVTWMVSYTSYLVIICLTILFAFSYRKQTDYIRNRVNHTNKDK